MGARIVCDSPVVQVLQVHNRALVEGLFASPTWLGTSAQLPNSLLRWNGQAWEPFVRFGLERSSWTFGVGNCEVTAQRVATGLLVETRPEILKRREAFP